MLTEESNGLSSYLFFMVFLDKRGRRQIAKAGLLTNPVVENFDVLVDFTFCIGTGSEAMVVNTVSIEEALQQQETDA